ncbi:MAG: hypothetical protein ABI767_04750 [Rhodanobacter sp.]
MTNNTREHTLLADDSYYHQRIIEMGQPVVIDGVRYRTLDSMNRPSGYQAVAYQRIDNGKITIANRGTEFGREPLRDGVKADGGMIRDNVNKQYPDAQEFTQRVIEQAKRIAEHNGKTFHLSSITTTGHSLGGTLSEMEADEFGLRGETYNSYGAAGLHYRGVDGRDHIVAEGGHLVIGHVRATDLVSSASPHFGEQHVYASPQDIIALRDGRYLDTPDPAHRANPLITASIAAHRMDNFTQFNGIEGESIISPQGEKLYQDNKAAIDHYRSDVMTSRIDLHDVLNHSRDPAHAARLEAQVDDALDIARYRLAVGAAERVTTEPLERELDAASQSTRASGQTIHAATEVVALGTQVAGQVIQSGAAEYSQDAHARGQILQHAANAVSREATGLPDPWLAAGVSLGAMGAGYVLHAQAEGAARVSHLAGQWAYATAEEAAQQIHAAGDRTQSALDAVSAGAHDASQSIHTATQPLNSTQIHDAIVDQATQVEHGMHTIHQRVEKTLEHTFDSVSQSVSRGVENVTQSVRDTYDALAPSGPSAHHDAVPASEHVPSAPPHSRSQGPSPGDPRHPGNPDHALYNALKERIPEASESRVVQFTAACHASRINDQNLDHVFLNEQAGLVGFTSAGLRPAVTSVDIKEAPPQAAQSIQHIQLYDQQQTQMMSQIQAQVAQSNAHGQQGPVLGG